jgi:hypothetical protein
MSDHWATAWEGDGQAQCREPGDQLVAVVFVQPG